ncbi:Hypothetical protein HDN1F_17070 [gamma proteobacterium HdN1]|nr:Hypothetical protein HDN1F_17070 [gamma proteobacterium HdN1]
MGAASAIGDHTAHIAHRASRIAHRASRIAHRASRIAHRASRIAHGEYAFTRPQPQRKQKERAELIAQSSPFWFLIDYFPLLLGKPPKICNLTSFINYQK